MALLLIDQQLVSDIKGPRAGDAQGLLRIPARGMGNA